MNLAGHVMRVYVPESVRRRALVQLFQATADALSVCAPDLADTSADQLLELFAAFSAEHAGALLQRGIESPLVRRRLCDAAYAIGAGLRAGQQLAWPDVPCRGDVFHVLREAQALVVSPNTIKTQVSSIYRKLGASRRAEAIAITQRLQLL